MPAPIAARRAPVLGLVVFLACALPTPAAAQTEEPIGLFAFDLRGSFVPFTRNADLAGRFGFTAPETPGPGWGLDAGAHLYPLRWRGITFGIGAGYHSSFANQSRFEPAPDPEDEPLALPSVRKRFTSVSSQVSLNFGSRNGWSYLSVGLGRSRIGLRALDAEAAPTSGVHTLSYGGGARWFDRPHLAFSLDARFYALRAPRMTVVVISIGASFK